MQTDTGATAAVALTLKQRGSAGHAQRDRSQLGPALLREAHACGTRTLIASAAACIDQTDMPLDVAFQSGDTALDGVVIWDEARGATSLSGTLSVPSLIFYGGRLELELGDVQVSAEITDDGTVKSVAYVEPRNFTATLERQRE